MTLMLIIQISRILILILIRAKNEKKMGNKNHSTSFVFVYSIVK